MTTDSLLEDLNPPQRLAVTTTEGPLIVIAGAGSGKTRVITYRIAYLVRECGVRPGNIFAATFTNKAADEMRERVRALLGNPREMPFAVSTFHSWCAGVLRREAEKIGIARDFTICDEDDQISAIKEVMRGLGIDPRRGPIQPSQARWAIDRAKTRLETPDQMRERAGESDRALLYADIYAAYENLLRRNNALDFGDLLVEVVRLFENDPETLRAYQERYRYLMVDEYQDTNHVQYRLVSALASSHRNICVVGDEDQSIYSWRGADIGNLLDFQKHFPEAKIIRLEQNYRSTQTILSAAAEVISRNRQRLGKTLWTDRGNGAPILAFEAVTDREEAAHIARLIAWFHHRCLVPYREMAVFYRTNALSRLIEEHLRAATVPYRVIGGVGFYERKEIKDLLAYLRVIANPYDSMALSRIINTPRRGIGQTTVNKILSKAMSENLPFIEAVEALRSEGGLGKQAEKKVVAFLDQLKQWAEAARSARIADLLELVLQDTRYIESLGDPDSLEVISRRENIEELKNAVAQFEAEHPDATLRDFLEYTSLRSSIDEYDSRENSVSLMTIHCAKGLEFRVVFIVALEKDVFPHILSLKEGSIEEERRLFYVGVTRAKDVLCLSWSASRYARGEPQWNTPSVFLHEIPRELVRPADDATLAEVRAELLRDFPQTGRDDVSPTPAETTAGRDDGAARDERISTARWHTGQSLVHPSLGRGIVAEIRGFGPKEILVVEFEDGQRLEFLSRYAHLKREKS